MRYDLRLQGGASAGKENRNWEARDQMHYQYFLDVSGDGVQYYETSRHHLEPINGRSAQENVPEYCWGRGKGVEKTLAESVILRRGSVA